MVEVKTENTEKRVVKSVYKDYYVFCNLVLNKIKNRKIVSVKIVLKKITMLKNIFSFILKTVFYASQILRF